MDFMSIRGIYDVLLLLLLLPASAALLPLPVGFDHNDFSIIMGFWDLFWDLLRGLLGIGEMCIFCHENWPGCEIHSPSMLQPLISKF
jgi:hypothetical protein